MITSLPAAPEALVLVISRYRVSDDDFRSFLEDARAALEALSAQPGFRRGHVGRATDDPGLWVLSSEWESVGAYRRALSAYDVKTRAVPVMYRALDEPSAFEILDQQPAEDVGPHPGTRRAADAGTVGVGDAAAPHVGTDLD
ncbi:MAG TPA: antibiotic biosynthesis monooxygenase family protein [Actinomycetes bacterium]